METRTISQLTDKELEQLELMAGMNYTPRRIALFFGLSVNECYEALKDPESEFHKRYRKGEITYESKVDYASLKNALDGNATAIQQYENKKRLNKLNEMKHELFGI
jgi:hypothetical protein